ncbi:uncharacterized protein [Clytia hemisphaerica]|uniref:uncharacterized protein n=1 Tax=Clytia hemisphaerica TaxID=252671 RepID=UPI0034D60E2F
MSLEVYAKQAKAESLSFLRTGEQKSMRYIFVTEDDLKKGQEIDSLKKSQIEAKIVEILEERNDQDLYEKFHENVCGKKKKMYKNFLKNLNGFPVVDDVVDMDVEQ